MDPEMVFNGPLHGQGVVAGMRVSGGTANVHFHHTGDRTRSAPLRNLPFSRNEDVVIRLAIFSQLDQLLPVSEARSAALWGLGGSGKTQVALEFAYRRAEDDKTCSIFWVHADTEATFAQDFALIARKAGLPTPNGEELLTAVCHFIESQPRWLLVLDNADDLRLFGVGATRQADSTTQSAPKNLYHYIPKGPLGSVLWTSRDSRIAGTLVGPLRAIQIASMLPIEAQALLAAIRGSDLSDEELDDAVALLSELHHIPLPSRSYTYWLVDNQNIPAEIIKAAAAAGISSTAGNSRDGSRGHSCADDESAEDPDGSDDATEEAVIRLREFSFLHMTVTPDGKTVYDMHQLVQEATLYSHSVDKDVKKKDCEEYVPHVLRASKWAEVAEEEIMVSDLLMKTSGYLHDRGRWNEKEIIDDKAFSLRREALGRKHPDTISSMARLTATYYAQGRYEEDERISEEVQELCQKILGKKHPDTISSMADLATTYHGQGRYKEAEKLCEEVVEMQQEILGRRHPDTFESMRGLAAIYHGQGRYEEAERIMIAVIELRQEILGKKHPDTISDMADLSTTYYGQGRDEEAEKLCEEALELRNEILGQKHPDRISSMANLATIYHGQGRYEEAEKIKEEVVEMQQEVLGRRHSDTVESMYGLAGTYLKQGRYNEAEKLSVEVLALRKEVLGETHPRTAKSMSRLAQCWKSQGRGPDAVALMAKCYQLQCDVLGPTHRRSRRTKAIIDSWNP
ncbi:TPR domain-containing protein [Colletotrichum incanum]|nr:TPR domain-containing protein [Colletotrichum incanum]